MGHMIVYRHLLLRERHFSFLVVSRLVRCVGFGVDMSGSKGDGSYRINITNGLFLYYHQYSYYSQKVVMALHEKNLPFETHIVEIGKGAQYEPWFLQINPRGEVPVLQDTGKIIPDSARIIDYLEDNFSNGDTPRLIPLDQGSDVKQKVTNFRNMIDQLPSGIITMGSFFHPELAGTPKAPFFAPVRKLLMNAENNSSQNLRKHAVLNPDCKDVLLQKAEMQDKKHITVTNKEEYLKVLDQVDNVLSKVEVELSTHIGERLNWWLCTDRFTVADIGLTILLERLNQLGFESRFWTKGIRPNIEIYYERVKNRDAYKKTIPSTLTHLKIILSTQKPVFIGISVVTAVAIIVGGVVLARKYLR